MLVNCRCAQAGVFVVGLCRAPAAVHPSIRRSGRLHSELHMRAPAVAQRRQMLSFFSEGWAHRTRACSRSNARTSSPRALPRLSRACAKSDAAAGLCAVALAYARICSRMRA
eukprot:2210036-Pleurochrysis_carterae.AAC.2